FGGGLIQDLSGNKVSPRSCNDALPAGAFDGNTDQPRLKSFDLDMNDGTMTLYFDETVNASSLNFAGFTLQSTNEASPLASWQLTSGTLVDPSYSTIVKFAFSPVDLNQLK